LINSSLSLCENITSGLMTLKRLQEALSNFSQTVFSCEDECESTSFEIEWATSHKNKLSVVQNIGLQGQAASPKEVLIAFEYKNTLTKEDVETYFYDDSSIFATAGGFLGLALGFSFLSTLKCLLKFIEEKPFRNIIYPLRY